MPNDMFTHYFLHNVYTWNCKYVLCYLMHLLVNELFPLTQEEPCHIKVKMMIPTPQLRATLK